MNFQAEQKMAGGVDNLTETGAFCTRGVPNKNTADPFLPGQSSKPVILKSFLCIIAVT